MSVSAYRIDNKNIKEQEQLLYDYLLARVRNDTPDNLLEDFRELFIEGRSFKEAHVYAALESLVKAKEAEERFNFCFNRCCHILINRWQMQLDYQYAIPELINLLDNLAPGRQGVSTTSNRLRILIKDFTLSDHYVKLERLARIIDDKDKNSNSIGTLINRYPYLYDHCLLSDGSSEEHQQTVRQIKRKIEKEYEINLSRYVTYQVRLAKLSQQSSTSSGSMGLIQPVSNPTLLSDRELSRSMKQYVGRVEGGYSYKSLSQNFITHSSYTSNYQTFKNDLYDYLVSSFENRRGKFPQKLYTVLQNTLPDCNSQKPTEFLMLRTSSQLLNYLVVESSQNPQHYVFIDLISNMGVTHTIGLLLKIVLICKKVKPYLEKRFSILFNHYEGFSRDGAPWLVKTLENLQLAFSLNFGKVDISSLQQLKYN
ncbi:conserved hypothetical protein [Gloeothece citriformis PCC 7424]|uniref:Uncharacterized protein n=1 Tax=Gloeothece citriformis (strain PCC 7424) TaxID=65393 RepID=B7KEX5_GLOC7|nr:hypothetical protein [Gloeothece citriformis]ACK70431.1 conserved hypothetical protein [Gloeothece citriformis PCC 7424]